MPGNNPRIMQEDTMTLIANCLEGESTPLALCVQHAHFFVDVCLRKIHSRARCTAMFHNDLHTATYTATADLDSHLAFLVGNMVSFFFLLRLTCAS